MPRLVATGEHKAKAARQMRATAAMLDDHHPEMMAGDHLRDAARLVASGRTEGAKRHLDAAMFMLTPQSLVRHGILDDDGHVDAKHHMHQINRHRLNVEDIEDIHAGNDRQRTLVRARRGEAPTDDDEIEEARLIAAVAEDLLAIELSARTPYLAVTPAPRGRPGGPGLYHQKGLGHTAYLQQVVKALIEKRGMKPSKAYAIARAAIRKWSVRSKHPEVRGAAARAEAGELAKQARAHAHTADVWSAIELTGPKGYEHGWIFKGIPTDLRTADRMGVDELKNHLANYHAGGPAGGHRIGPRNPSKAQILAQHEQMHAQAEEGQATGRSGLYMSSEHSHGIVRANLIARNKDLRNRLSDQPYPTPDQMRGRNLASDWAVADVLVELACDGPAAVIDLFNPYHAPTGQFTTASGAGQGGKGKQGKQQPGRAAKRKQLVRQIASLHQQIAALRAQLPTTRGAHKARTPAKAKTTAQAAAAAARKAKTGATPRKKGVAAHRMSPATIHAKIAALQATLRADVAQLRALK